MSVALTVVVPRSAAVGASSRPGGVYLRRRLAVAVGLGVFLLALLLGAGSVLANRGSAPASTPAVRPASASQPSAQGIPYVVQPGDTLWSIAASYRNGASQDDYVERLLDLNGGSSLQIGQLLSLP